MQMTGATGIVPLNRDECRPQNEFDRGEETAAAHRNPHYRPLQRLAYLVPLIAALESRIRISSNRKVNYY